MHARVRIGLSTALALSLVWLGACSSDDDDGDTGTDDTTSTTEAAAPDLELVTDGTLTVCSDTPYEPFEFTDEDGVDTGYDIDLLRAVADGADLGLEVLDLPFDGILGALAAGQCDVVASAVTITDERAEQVDFSQPYFDADQSLLVRADEVTTYASLADLAGKTIGVQAGTTGEAYANDNKPDGATVKSFEDADGLFGAITSGDIDAVLQDFPVNAYRATQDDAFAVTESFPTGEQYGFAVEKGNAGVLALIDDGLDALRDSGEFDRIFSVYFGEPAA